MLGCRYLWLGLGVALLTPPLAKGQSTAAQQVATLVAQYDSGWNRKDTVAVSRLLAPHYQYFTSRGDVSSRARVMDMLGSPDYFLERAERSEVVVSHTGAVAVVSSRWQGQGTYKGSRFTDDQRCGQVWLQAGTTWQVLSEHCVQIAPKSPAPSQARAAPSDSAVVHELSRQFSAAYVRGDGAAMAKLYTPQAVIFPERSEMIVGREAIQGYWTLKPGQQITHHAITPSRIVFDGEHAYDYGTFEVAGKRDGTAWGHFGGKYVVVWQRQPGGRWLIQLDIWNSRPQPGS
jgi:ketosteroid isomerase-like protein